jgi:hypothetical protein
MIVVEWSFRPWRDPPCQHARRVSEFSSLGCSLGSL